MPSANQAAKDVVSKELVKKLGDEFYLEQPLRISAEAQYPITATLPGGAFSPVSQNVVKNLYAHSRDGHVHFPPGDYEISIFNYCMLAHQHVPTRNKFRLTPIQGQWADIASALFARTSYGYNPHDVQILTWSLLAGMKYQELSPASRHLVDTVLPEFKSRMQESFYEKLQRYWGQISSNVPGVPSFDAALGQMGDVGKEIIQLRDIRNELIANAANYDSIMRDFATDRRWADPKRVGANALEHHPARRLRAHVRQRRLLESRCARDPRHEPSRVVAERHACGRPRSSRVAADDRVRFRRSSDHRLGRLARRRGSGAWLESKARRCTRARTRRRRTEPRFSARRQ